MIRSLVFTLLLEEPEFGALSTDDASRVVTDAVERVRLDQLENSARTTADCITGYIHDITAGGTTEPGIWSRYVAALRAGDERR